MKVGQKILAERKKRNWTQTELADRCKLSQPVIARYEGGEPVSPRNLNKISDAFDLDVRVFTSLIEEEEQLTSDEKNDVNLAEMNRMFKEAKSLPYEDRVALFTFLRTLMKVKKYENGLSIMQEKA